MTITIRRRRWRSLIALGVCLGLLAAACGDDETSTGNEPDTPTTAPSTTQPDDGGTDDPLAPQPLDKPTTVKVAASIKIDSFAPVLLADELGEFAKENITIEYVTANAADQLQLLATGDVHAAMTGISAGLLNAIDQGLGMKIVGPTHIPGDGDKSGLWVTDKVLKDGELDADALRNAKVASPTGPGSGTMYALLAELAPLGIGPDDITIQQLGGADILTALENGALDAGWLVSPIWQEAEKNPNLHFAVGQTEGVSLGAIVFGRKLISEDREVGVAFTRAVARTVRTHLQGDYYDDPAVLEAMAKVTGAPAENLTANPHPKFDPDLTVKEGFLEELQAMFIEQGVLNYSAPKQEDEIVDRSFAQEVLP